MANKNSIILLAFWVVSLFSYAQASLAPQHRLETFRYRYKLYMVNGDSMELTDRILHDKKKDISYIKHKGKVIQADQTTKIVCMRKDGYMVGESYLGKWLFPLIQTYEYITLSTYSEPFETYTTHIKLMSVDTIIALNSYDSRVAQLLVRQFEEEPKALAYINKSNKRIKNRHVRLALFISTAASLGVCFLVPLPSTIITNALATYGFIGIIPTGAMYFTLPQRIPYLRLKGINLYTNKRFGKSSKE